LGVGSLATTPQSRAFLNGVSEKQSYIDELLPDILEGRIQPGRVFDQSVGLDGVPDGYRAMADRESIKVMVRP